MPKQRKQFGTRFLTDPSEIFQYNAWDNVSWNMEQEIEARNRIAVQRETCVPIEHVKYLLQNAAEQWDGFYRKHGDKFFMNRNWLLIEFPELDIKQRESSNDRVPFRILDVGCGVGNATIPLLQTFVESPEQMFTIYACDYSREAVNLLKQKIIAERYSDRCKPFVWDIAGPATDVIAPESLDVILCIYVLSAVPRDKQQRAVENLTRLLKPGGILLLKDYAQYDMTQLRFKTNRLIDENFYRRGDGTLVYFFTQEQLDRLFTDAGLKKEINVLDRRLIVNRAKQVKMYRMWIQCKYVKA